MESTRDLELWRRWHTTRSPADLELLMAQVQPILQKEVNRWASTGSREFLMNEAKKLAIKAFESFDPAKAQLNTYLTWQLQKLSRSAYERQSTVSIPEAHRLLYNNYVRAKADLEDTLGHPPTMEHIADHLAVPMPRLMQVIANVGHRKELMESGDGPAFGASRDTGANVELAYHQLTPRQQKIFDMRTGSHGVPEAANDQEILKGLGITQGVLSYELTKIVAKMKMAQAL